ncbi:MAG: anthranilate synthase component I family protein [Verrucomicrobia subdivision 3 bacterium]|nr:anthranilate synthase component I family protein [Limisphaerales bacterium]
MRSIVQEVATQQTPESLVESHAPGAGLVLLRSAMFDSPQARYSFVAANPFLAFCSTGSRCEFRSADGTHEQFGDPWSVLDTLMSRYELLEDIDLPFPLGGCFGYWGYDLKNFVEPHLPRTAVNDLELPDCHVGFYDSLVVFDHRLDKVWVVSTGCQVDGSRDEAHALRRLAEWTKLLGREPDRTASAPGRGELRAARAGSTLGRERFMALVRRAQQYIRNGDVYQVNLAHRLDVDCLLSGWGVFRALAAISPAPFSGFLDCGDFQIASSSPEMFLRVSGRHIQTRPIKGTRPRSGDATRDAQLTYELQTSAKDLAELVMITDLLRNDLGRVCEYGSVQVPELVRLERYPHVQHLVSTVEGCLRSGVTHFDAFAKCFPGGSITGAPKIRAMEIIDELEPVTRGPYTGCMGYLGFNRESQVNILIRSALIKAARAYFHAGAGIVADSNPAAEYDETMSKAAGFLAALNCDTNPVISASPVFP